jgi:hypothetical protein
MPASLTAAPVAVVPADGVALGGVRRDAAECEGGRREGDREHRSGNTPGDEHIRCPDVLVEHGERAVEHGPGGGQQHEHRPPAPQHRGQRGELEREGQRGEQPGTCERGGEHGGAHETPHASSSVRQRSARPSPAPR